MWQPRSLRPRLLGEDSASFKIFAEDADAKTVENEASGEDGESTDEDPTESRTQTTTALTTWKPPHVETQSVLQLHL